MIQRVLGGHSQSVTIRGTFTGTAIASIEAEVVDFETGSAVVPWTALGAASGGTYSGTLTVPEGGWYRIVVRGLAGGQLEVARQSGVHSSGWE